MNLRETGIREQSPAFVRPPDGCCVRTLSVCRKIIDIDVAARRQDNRIAQVCRNLAGHEVPCHDASRSSVDHNQIEHLRTREHCHAPRVDLPFERLVSPQEKLLTCLAACIKSTRDLRSSKRAIRQRASVFTGERNALRNALIDDGNADLCETVDIGFAGAKVSALYRVVEQPVNAIAIVWVVLGSVDSALRRDGVSAPRRILKAEALHAVAQFAQTCGGRRSGQTRADNNDVVLAFISGIHQLHFEACFVPCLFNGPGGCTRMEFHGYFTIPVRTPIGTEIKPRKITTAKNVAARLSAGV